MEGIGFIRRLFLRAIKITTVDQSLLNLAKRVGQCFKQRGFMLATAESCTGGWLAQEITAIAGSSEWFECGFVTYSNRSKCELLGVNPAVLEEDGAVSEKTAREMAVGALKLSQAWVSVSITGIAGPNGGYEAKPVGTVCFAWALKDGTLKSKTCHFNGDRRAVRCQSVQVALQGLLNFLDEQSRIVSDG